MVSADSISTIPDGTSNFVPLAGSDIPSAICFRTAWEPSIQPGTILDEAFSALSSAYQGKIGFYVVDAEECPDLSDFFCIEIVPTFVLLRADGTTVQEKLEGIPEVDVLTRAVTSLVTSVPAPAAPTASDHKPDDLETRLTDLVGSSTVMLFMKGSPKAPRCGFSRQAIEMLDKASLAYGTFDILSNEEVRQGLKKFSDWPTYPQLYVNGELMGGVDIIKEMNEGGNLAQELGVEAVPAQESLQERLSKLVRRSRVILFMKGVPSAPKCGFSRQVVEILEGLVEGDRRVPYDTFNILEDEEVRQGLKTFSDWPTYPQLYVDGELLGGIDIIREMKESGDLDYLLDF